MHISIRQFIEMERKLPVKIFNLVWMSLKCLSTISINKQWGKLRKWILEKKMFNTIKIIVYLNQMYLIIVF